MSNKPWIKFYPSDWRSDPALRRVSSAARGLWIDMLCIMHEAEPYGHLMIKGVPVSDVDLARLVGVGLKETRKLLAELIEKGVSSTCSSPCSSPTSSTTSAEVYFSRRMVADNAKALKDKENGKAGGNPALTPGVKGELKAQKPEARSQKEESLAAAPPIDRKSVAGFIDRMLGQFPEFGAQAARSPALLSPADVNRWIAAGYDLALDVEPAVVSILGRPRSRPPSSWSYFENAVLEQNRKRIALPNAGQPAPVVASKRAPDGSRLPDRDGVVRLRLRSAVDGSWNDYEPDAPELRDHLRVRVSLFLAGRPWPEDDLGPPPGHPACLVPPKLLARLMPPVTTSDGTESTVRH